MNDPYRDIESELRQLSAHRLSTRLMAQLERDLTDAMSSSSSNASRTAAEAVHFPRRWLAWGAAVIVVGLAWWILAYFVPERGKATIAPEKVASAAVVTAAPSAAASLFKPVSATNLCYASYDEGLTHLSDGWPARRVYDRYLDVYTWRNPHTRALVQWTVPREEVRLVPLNAY